MYVWTFPLDETYAIGSLISSTATFDSLINDNERFMCFLEICSCFVGRFTIQRYRGAFYRVWRLLCSIAGKPFSPYRDDAVSEISFEGNHYARLKSAAKKSLKKEISDKYLIMNSYSTK